MQKMLSTRLSFKVDSPQYSRRFAICIIIYSTNLPLPHHDLFTIVAVETKHVLCSILVHTAGIRRFASLTAYVALVKLIQH